MLTVHSVHTVHIVLTVHIVHAARIAHTVHSLQTVEYIFHKVIPSRAEGVARARLCTSHPFDIIPREALDLRSFLVRLL